MGIEHVRIPTRNLTADFMKPMEVLIGFSNKCDVPVMIDEIQLVAQRAHTCIPESDVTIHHKCATALGALSASNYERVRFDVSLCMLPATNMLQVFVLYRTKKESE